MNDFLAEIEIAVKQDDKQRVLDLVDKDKLGQRFEWHGC